MRTAEPTSGAIRLAAVFPPTVMLLGARQESKQSAIRALIRHLVKLGQLPAANEEPVVEQILNRERMGTTALGNGIAIPNCLSPHTDRFLGALSVLSDGIDFNAVDGELVRSVFLIVGPPQHREQHFELLGRITAIGRDKSLRLQLQGCRTAEGIQHFLEELDRNAELSLPKGRRFL